MPPTTDGGTRRDRSRGAALAFAGAALALFIALAAALPLLGAASRGASVASILTFPPKTTAVAVPGFSGPVALVLAVLIGIGLVPFAWRWWKAPSTVATPVRVFPWWGWAGAVLLATSWTIAWTRLPAMAEIQRYTFTPLWLGYILIINALSYRRSGACLLIDRPRFFAALFPLSAIFWWYFEYLNRFVRNWYYEGVDTLSASQYVIEASVPFATVLPAVLSTAQWLGTFPRWNSAFVDWRCVAWARAPQAAWIALLLGSLSLVAIGRWPLFAYPLVWVAPLLVLCALQGLTGRRPLCEALARGDWRPVVFPATAALICGFFWELWNYMSLARWVYNVPYVTGLRVFEMPLLGYAGYLPFGLVCVAVVDLFQAVAAPTETALDSQALSRPGQAGSSHRARPSSSPPQIEVPHD